MAILQSLAGAGVYVDDGEGGGESAGKANAAVVDLDGDGIDDTVFAALSGGCHVASVTCVDVCFGTFPLAVTASADRTARLWHLEEYRCMAVHRNNGYDICSVSIHPGGTIVAVSDENGIKLCDVCDQELAPADWAYDDKLTDKNGLRLRAILPTKSSGAMRFSNGGSYLAATHRNQVHVYHVWTRTLVVTLVDPVKTVTSLAWSPDDSRLSVGCAGGSLNVYRMQVDLGDDPAEGSRRRKAKQKTTQQIEYEGTMRRINARFDGDEDGGEGADSDDASSDASVVAAGGGGGGASTAGGASSVSRDLARMMHIKSLEHTVKSCKLAGVAQIAPRPGSLQFARGERGLGAVATGGSDGVLRLIRGVGIRWGGEGDVGTAVQSSCLASSCFCGRSKFDRSIDRSNFLVIAQGPRVGESWGSSGIIVTYK